MLKGFGAWRTEELVSPRIVCAYIEWNDHRLQKQFTDFTTESENN